MFEPTLEKIEVAIEEALKGFNNARFNKKRKDMKKFAKRLKRLFDYLYKFLELHEGLLHQIRQELEESGEAAPISKAISNSLFELTVNTKMKAKDAKNALSELTEENVRSAMFIYANLKGYVDFHRTRAAASEEGQTRRLLTEELTGLKTLRSRAIPPRAIPSGSGVIFSKRQIYVKALEELDRELHKI